MLLDLFLVAELLLPLLMEAAEEECMEAAGDGRRKNAMKKALFYIFAIVPSSLHSPPCIWFRVWGSSCV